MFNKFLFFSAALLFGAAQLDAAGSGIGPAYVVDDNTDTVYSVDLQTGVYSTVVTIPSSSLADVAVLNANTVYAVGSTSGAVYAINTQTKQYNQIASIGPDFVSIQILNNHTAVLANNVTNEIYEVNLVSGASNLVATLPGNPGIGGIALAGNQLLYTAGFVDNNVYAVNLETGESKLITPAPLSGNPNPAGAALENPATLYLGGNLVHNLFQVDTASGNAALLSPTNIGSNNIYAVGLSGQTAYVTNVTGQIFAVNLLNGSYTTLATIPGAFLTGIGLWLQIPTAGLSGNNLSLASYVNDNGTFDVLNSLAFLGSGVEAGLLAVSPARNALSTFAAQNAQMASSQTLIDHMHLKRLEKTAGWTTETVAYKQENDGYIAGTLQPKKEEKKRGPYTVWATPFGEYAKGKGSGLLPNFDAGLGGILVGFDGNGENGNSIGFAAAYAFTHLHEHGGAGSANINQGFLTLYGEFVSSDWYLDLGLWGGYYASRNVRQINYSYVDETARSTIHGWQFAPYFEAGYDGFLSKADQSKWLGVEPFILADWVADWESGFHETGAGSFDMAQKGRFCSLLRGESGLRLHQVIQMDWGLIFFTEKGSYAYQKPFDTGKITAFLVGSPGTFTVETFQGAQNLGVAEVAIFFSPKGKKMPYFDLRYQGEFGSKYQSHQGMLEIGKTF